jgi:hypothetical protein
MIQNLLNCCEVNIAFSDTILALPSTIASDQILVLQVMLTQLKKLVCAIENL